MRTLLVFLLHFIVIFQGSVNAYAFKMPCPMDHDASLLLMSVDDTAQAVEGCCNDAQTAVKTGKLCKTDTPCGSSGVYVVPLFHAHLPSVQTSDPVPMLIALFLSFDPFGIWRPPSLS